MPWFAGLLLYFTSDVDFTLQVSSPLPSEKQAPPGTVWEVADFEPEQLETQRRVVPQEEAGSLHSGYQEQLSQQREYRPLPKNGKKNSEYTQVRDRVSLHSIPKTMACSV